MNYFWKTCYFGHKWGKWGEPEFRKITTSFFDVVMGEREALTQVRICNRCGIRKARICNDSI